jgi:hypothetical protein
LMRHIFESRAVGVTSTGPSIPPVPPSTSYCRRYAMPPRPSACSALALSDPSHPQPRVINTDKARLYGSAIAALKEEGTLRRRCRHRPVQYLTTPRAGSSRYQTTREGQAELSRVPSGPANACRIRGDAHDPEGAGAVA